MDVTTGLLLSYALVFALNLVPAFMPPTWSVLAFIAIAGGLPPYPLAIGGALAASSGRLALALASRRFGRPFLTPRQRSEVAWLGAWIDTRGRVAAPLAMLIYSFGPIPSNQLFIAAGLCRARLAPFFLAFLAGRLVSYPLWIAGAGVAVAELTDVLTGHLRSTSVILLELLALAGLFAFTRIRWTAVLARAVSGSRTS